MLGVTGVCRCRPGMNGRRTLWTVREAPRSISQMAWHRRCWPQAVKRYWSTMPGIRTPTPLVRKPKHGVRLFNLLEHAEFGNETATICRTASARRIPNDRAQDPAVAGNCQKAPTLRCERVCGRPRSFVLSPNSLVQRQLSVAGAGRGADCVLDPRPAVVHARPVRSIRI